MNACAFLGRTSSFLCLIEVMTWFLDNLNFVYVRLLGLRFDHLQDMISCFIAALSLSPSETRTPLPLSLQLTGHLALALVRFNLLPQAVVLLDLNRLAGVKLIEAAEVHVLGQQRDHIFVECLPVRVLEMVSAIVISII